MKSLGDYDDIGPVYNQYGLNLLAVDYRGYGTSGGTPTVTAMLKDSHVIIQRSAGVAEKEGYAGTAVDYGSVAGQRFSSGTCFRI